MQKGVNFYSEHRDAGPCMKINQLSLHTSSLQLDAWGGTEVPASHGVVLLP